jgi:hypothetical protein
MHANIGAAIDGDDAGAVTAVPQVEQCQQQADVSRIVGGILEELKADAEGGIVRPAIFVKAIDDHRAVLGRGENERKLAGRIGHRSRCRVRQTHPGAGGESDRRVQGDAPRFARRRQWYVFTRHDWSDGRRRPFVCWRNAESGESPRPRFRPRAGSHR